MIVVKVGGSLYDHPGLGPGLREFLGTLAPSSILIVPGGGEFADAVRKLDAVHQLGEECAHWLALTSLRTTQVFFQHLLPGSGSGGHPLTERSESPTCSIQILDLNGFCLCDNHLPQTWEVTSDSIAARAAIVYRATRLILLKSVDVPQDTPWTDAAERGWVDRHFPHLMVDLRVPVEVINFRRWLDEHATPFTGHVNPVDRS